MVLIRSPDILARQFAKVVLQVILILPVLQIYFKIIVDRGFIGENASKDNNRIICYGFMKAKLSTY